MGLKEGPLGHEAGLLASILRGVSHFGGFPHTIQVKFFKHPRGTLTQSLSKGSWAGMAAAALLVMTAGLSGCGSTPEDEFSSTRVDQLYADAREEASEGNYENAIKRYEKVEARASGTLMAQQAQLELAYAYYKTGERAQ